MNAGRYVFWEKLRLNLRLATSATEGSEGHSRARLMARRTLDPSTIQEGEGDADVCLSIVNPIAGGDATVDLALEGLGLGSFQESLSGTVNDIETTILFEDFNVHWDGTNWDCAWSDLIWIVSSTVRESLGPGSIATNYVTPASLPILGIVGLDSGAQSDGDIVVGSEHDWTVEADAQGGWEFFENGEWHSMPVRVVIKSPSGAEGCPHTINAPILSGLKTDELRAVGYHRTRWHYQEDAEVEVDLCPDGQYAHIPWRVIPEIREADEVKRDGELIAFCDLNRDLRRLNEDFGLIVERLPFPEVNHREVAACFGQRRSDTCEEWEEWSRNWEDRLLVHLPQVPMVRVVGASEHEVEAPTRESPMCWYRYNSFSFGARHVTLRVVAPGACSLIDPEDPPAILYPKCLDYEQYEFLRESTVEIEVVRPMAAYLDHVAPVVRYANSWGAPWWSFCTFWPHDADESFWKAGHPLAKVLSKDYWLRLRQQYALHPTIPIAEHTKLRNFIVTEPLLECVALSDFVKSRLTGVEGGFVGISRFSTAIVAPVASQALDEGSETEWTFSDCTAAFSESGIAITADHGESTLVAEYTIGSWVNSPCLYPHVCNAVSLGWDEAGVESVKVFIENRFGRRFLIATEPGKYPRPTVAEDEYIGSWAQDFGLGQVTDEGADLLPSGNSAIIATGSEANVAYELLLGHGAAKLVFEIELTSVGGSCELYYPVFWSDERIHEPLLESSNTYALLFDDSVGLRYGQWLCHAPENLSYLDGDLPMPLLRVGLLWGRMTVTDYLIYRRLVWEGRRKDDGLSEELSDLFDATEGNSPEDARSDTYAVWLKTEDRLSCRVLIVNGYRELPPHYSMPVLDMDNAYWQGVYSQSGLNRRLFNPVELLALDRAEFDGGGETSRTRLTNEENFALGHWRVALHHTPVENDETTDRADVRVFVVSPTLGDVARVAPWHGYHANVGASISGEDRACVESDGPRQWLHIGAGRQIRTHEMRGLGLNFTSAEHNVDYWLRLRSNSRSGLLLCLGIEDDEAVIFTSRDGGQTVSEVARMTANSALIERSSVRGVLVLLYGDGDDLVWRRISTDGGESWTSPASTSYSGGQLQAELLDITEDERSAILAMACRISGETVVLISEDVGETWKLGVG